MKELSLLEQMLLNGARIITDKSELGYMKNHKYGKFAPATGFYQLIDVERSSGEGLTMPIYAHYKSEETDNFSDKEFLFEGKFLYNSQSIGDKDTPLKAGMIIHIQDFLLVDAKNADRQVYKAVWKIVAE